MRLESNGCIFHCRVEGTLGCPWLTLSHALATDMSLWDDLVPYLSKHYRILRYDARGHGGSASVEGDYSLEMMCLDVIGLLDALGVGRTHFLGLSMGAMVGMGLALDHSERLSSAIICDARATATDAYRSGWAVRLGQVEAKGIDAIVDSSVERWFTEKSLHAEPELITRAKAMIRRTSRAGYRGSAAALMALDYEARLAEIRLPVLYLVGQEDQGAPAPVMLSMHHDTPNSRFVGIPYAGHLSVLERPEVFATSVLGFLSEVDASTQSSTKTTASVV
jgi:3-oxoadipate enol-lactonase